MFSSYQCLFCPSFLAQFVPPVVFQEFVLSVTLKVGSLQLGFIGTPQLLWIYQCWCAVKKRSQTNPLTLRKTRKERKILYKAEHRFLIWCAPNPTQTVPPFVSAMISTNYLTGDFCNVTDSFIPAFSEKHVTEMWIFRKLMAAQNKNSK